MYRVESLLTDIFYSQHLIKQTKHTVLIESHALQKPLYIKDTSYIQDFLWNCEWGSWILETLDEDDVI